LKKLLFISLAAILALSVGLVGCSAPTEYDLTIASTSGGSIFPAAGVHSYASGQVVDIKATPASDNYEFVNWTGDVDDVADVNAATTTITMDASASITANFQSKPWTSTITLTLHLTMPSSASLWGSVYQPWVGNVSAATGSHGGKFKFDVTFGPEPWDETVGLEAIGSGVTDLGQLNGDQFKLGTIGYIPFLWNMEQCAYATFNLFNTEVATWDKFGELDSVKILLSTPLQPNQWWGNVDVKTKADLAGKKVRAESALEADTITALGATPITGLEAGDLGSAMQLGTIDGCFFTYSAWSFGIVDATKYTTQVNLFPRVYVLAMNKAKYDGLPAEAKTLLDSFCTAQWSVNLAKAHDAAQAFGIGITKGFINMPGDGKVANPRMPYILPDAELANWKTATAGIKDIWIADMNALGFDGQAMYNRAVALAAQTPA
jgi:TRAP-type C4-dicarboxylate transport system substrate-binding protein